MRRLRYTPGVPLSAWARPGRCRARTPAGEVYAEGMKARVATAVGFVARLRCVEAGARRGGLAPPMRVVDSTACATQLR